MEPLGMYPPRAGNPAAKRIYNALLTAWMMRKARAVIAASPAEVADLVGVADEEKIVLRRNGVDVGTYATLPPGDSLRERWGIAPTEKLVLFVGRLSPIKNLEQLIQAFGRAGLPSTRLVLVGPGEPTYEAKLRALIAAEKLGARVLLAGPLYDQEQKAALATADLFVLPSLNESFGNAAAEAVAAAVPVLLTRSCGVAPLIHERAGLAVALGVESIADGMRRMLDPNACEQLTARREEVTRELSWDEPVRETAKLYARILADSIVERS
jgi:glycosyltransferase involved in cell wall biosynthesis